MVTVNNAVAIGAIEALLENSISVSDDVSIVGFDDINISTLVRVP
jgi:DNA-binding LacI/PurR family transcriptional regulator